MATFVGKAAVVEGIAFLSRSRRIRHHPFPTPFYPVNYSSTLANERVEDRALIKAIKWIKHFPSNKIKESTHLEREDSVLIFMKCGTGGPPKLPNARPIPAWPSPPCQRTYPKRTSPTPPSSKEGQEMGTWRVLRTQSGQSVSSWASWKTPRRSSERLLSRHRLWDQRMERWVTLERADV